MSYVDIAGKHIIRRFRDSLKGIVLEKMISARIAVNLMDPVWNGNLKTGNRGDGCERQKKRSGCYA